MVFFTLTNPRDETWTSSSVRRSRLSRKELKEIMCVELGRYFFFVLKQHSISECGRMVSSFLSLSSHVQSNRGGIE